MLILFVDDEIARHELTEKILGKKHTIIHAYDYDECLQLFKVGTEVIGLMMLDHDLQDFKKVGDELIDFNGSRLISQILTDIPKEKLPPRAILHSWNPSGALNMESKLKGFGMHTTVQAFSEKMLLKLLEDLTPQ